MKKIYRKLFLSILMLFVTIVTLTSTTFAWFASNRESWVDPFALEIENSEGLYVSIDGKTYGNSVSNSDLSKAIVAKKLNKNVSDVTTDDIVNNLTSLKPITTKDMINFTTVDIDSVVDKDNFYVPHAVDSKAYAMFDLYFKIEASKNSDKKYDLCFAPDPGLNVESNGVSKIEAPVSLVSLTNKLTTQDTTYFANETIKVNPANAMRIGVFHGSETTVYEITDEYDLGSYAIYGEGNPIYNPNQNAMFTYFNNSHVSKLRALEKDDFYYNTVKSFDDMISLGLFEIANENQGYNEVKITICIWLEGYDADYISGISTNEMKIFLNFIKRDHEEVAS